MHMNYMSLAEFYSLLGDAEKSEAYLDKADALQRAIQSVLWVEKEKMWFDFDFLNTVRSTIFFIPLYAKYGRIFFLLIYVYIFF